MTIPALKRTRPMMEAQIRHHQEITQQVLTTAVHLQTTPLPLTIVPPVVQMTPQAKTIKTRILQQMELT